MIRDDFKVKQEKGVLGFCGSITVKRGPFPGSGPD